MKVHTDLESGGTSSSLADDHFLHVSSHGIKLRVRSLASLIMALTPLTRVLPSSSNYFSEAPSPNPITVGD